MVCMLLFVYESSLQFGIACFPLSLWCSFRCVLKNTNFEISCCFLRTARGKLHMFVNVRYVFFFADFERLGIASCRRQVDKEQSRF